MDKYINLLKRNYNIVLTEAPGTGKTYINNVRMERKINRIKVMLAEKGKTNKWLFE